MTTMTMKQYRMQQSQFEVKAEHALVKLPGIGWGGWKCFKCGKTFKRKPSKTSVCIKEATR